MKKVLGGIFILVFILLMGSPWYVGTQVETFYNQVTEETLKNNPTLDLTDLNYQRGWFSSTITGSIALNTMDEALPFDIRYKSVVTHGPVFWSALSAESPVGLAFDNSTIWIEPTGDNEEDNALIKELPPFEIKSVIGFDKLIQSVFSIAAYAKAIESAETPADVNFAGLNGVSTFNWESKDFQIDMEMPSFTFKESEKEHLDINAVTLTAYKKGGDSSARYDIARIAMESEESNIQFNLEKLYLAGSNVEAEEVFNSALKSGFEKLSANELKYAPAELHIKLDNLDKESMLALKDTVDEASANPDAMNSDMYGMMIMGKMMELLPEILKRDPKLTLETLKLGTAKGEAVTATGYAAVIGEKAAALPSMMMMVQALDARFEAALPKTFLNTFMDLGKLMQLMDQGFLVSDGNYYRIEASVNEGHLTINGNTIM